MNSFIKYHVSIDKGAPVPAIDSGCYSDLRVERLDVSFSSFRMLIDRVGSMWGWTRRPRYYGSQTDVKRLIAHPETRLYLLKKQDMPIGYCFVVPFSRALSHLYPKRDNLDGIVEIENFGLFPEYTGNGYGRFFLAHMFQELFRDYDTIYLSSRSTNHKKVIPFYRDMGMQVICTEELPDDLVVDDFHQTEIHAA